MGLSSVLVVVAVLALAAFAVWRNLRKGTPCECGGECRACRGRCHCDVKIPENALADGRAA